MPQALSLSKGGMRNVRHRVGYGLRPRSLVIRHSALRHSSFTGTRHMIFHVSIQAAPL